MKGGWSDSMEWYCYLRNVQDLPTDGKTPYERRFGEPFKGLTMLFGAMVEYHPISARDSSRTSPNLARKYYQESFLSVN